MRKEGYMGNKIEEILEICLEKIDEGIPIDEVLMEYPEHREELKELLNIAINLKNMPTPTVREEVLTLCLFKVRDSLQLRGERRWRARLQKLQWPRLRYFPSPALAKALAFILIITIFSWGIVNLSGSSLPGDVLYPIKLTTEKIRVFLTIDPEEKAELRFTYSEARMKELVRYLDEKGELNSKVLKAMLKEAAMVTHNISMLPKGKAIVCCLKLEHLCTLHIDILKGLKFKVPAHQRQELDNAIETCELRMEWMGKVIRGEVPIGEWGPFRLSET